MTTDGVQVPAVVVDVRTLLLMEGIREPSHLDRTDAQHRLRLSAWKLKQLLPGRRHQQVGATSAFEGLPVVAQLERYRGARQGEGSE